MRVLLTGANGMLARALVETAPSNVELIARSRAELDVTDADAIQRELASTKPTVIINAAAYTAVDRAESDIDAAERVNGIAPGLLGAAAARIDAKMVHYSTDYVFDGRNGGAPYREDFPPNPINAYGRSKLHGEQALRNSGARHLILRTQWLFSDSGGFPDAIWARARAGLPTRVVNDQWGAPTYAGDLARATWSLLDNDDIIHVANAGVATWFEIAQRIFAAAGSLLPLTPCSTGEYPQEAQRPFNAVLDTTRLRLLGIVMPAWTVGIDDFIARRLAAEAP